MEPPDHHYRITFKYLAGMTNSDIIVLELTFDHTGNLDLVLASHLGLKAYTLALITNMATLDTITIAATAPLQSNKQST